MRDKKRKCLNLQRGLRIKKKKLKRDLKFKRDVNGI